jgi:type II secretory pathway predicted ATPase ExeA
LYASEAFEESFARMEFLAQNRKRCGLLIGGSGVGKSTLAAYAATNFRRRGSEVVQLDLLAASEFDILTRLSIARLPRGSRRVEPLRAIRFQLWRQVVERCNELRCQAIPLVILADHVDRADESSWNLLQRVVQFHESTPGMLTLILVADEARIEKLPPALLEICELRIDLVPWALEDVVRYLEKCYVTPSGACLFHGDAAVRLWELGNGNPRRIVQLAALAQVAAFDQKRGWIGQEIMAETFDELSVPAMLAAANSNSRASTVSITHPAPVGYRDGSPAIH